MTSRPDSDGPSTAWTLPDELRMLVELGDADTVREVILVFQSDTEVRIRKIKNGLAEGDAPAVRAEAHAIKGSAGQVGAAHFSQLCREVEAAALRQDLAEAGRLMPQLEVAFAAVRIAMSQAKIA